MGIAPGKGEETDSAQGFLLNALDPPHLLSITNAIQLLQMIGCIDENESITATGRAVSKLPMDPRISRIVLLGCLFGCGPALLSTTATMAYRDPFLLPTRSNEQGSTNTKGRLSSGIPSDQYAILRALEQFKTLQLRFGYHKANAFCDEHNLSRSTMSFLSDLTQQLTYSMKDVGIFMSNNKISKNNGNANLVSSLIGMALYPDIGVRNNGGSYTTEKGRKARVHPSSVNFKASIISKKSKVHDLMKVIGFQVCCGIACYV